MKKNNNTLSIIAGPCSIDIKNVEELYEISRITVKDRSGEIYKAIFGVRIVGLKSRTEFDKYNKKYMGIDFEFYVNKINFPNTQAETNSNKLFPPSVKIAQEFVSKTGLLVATEIMFPHIQIPYYAHIPKKKMLFWNPSVNQLGWSVYQTAYYCAQKGWYLGLKNGKWFNQKINADTMSSVEKSWLGLSTYATETKDIIFIQRGVDIPHNELFRNYPIHKASERVKGLSKKPMFFDPSHSFGSKLRNDIVSLTLDAMKLRTSKGDYLYDGLLIETGNSQSDTDQHISISELKLLTQELSQFRDINSPSNPLVN